MINVLVKGITNIFTIGPFDTGLEAVIFGGKLEIAPPFEILGIIGDADKES